MTPELEKQMRDWVAVSEGWMEAERALEMAQYAIDASKRSKNPMLVEIGVFGGRSLISQALALKSIGAGRIYGIDPWWLPAAIEGENQANRDWWSNNVDLDKIHKTCMDAVWSKGLQDVVTVIRARSQDAESLFEHHAIDMLFIDSCHSEVASCRDVNLWVNKVRSGGAIFFDDANWESTQKAIALLEKEAKLIKDGGEYRIYCKK